ncbi:GNAT family N-acetyltransferase [Gymnodinialimonas hymeniacidonis]|uniref:GNAT family N-acetyltransferase n=1 Tax=Gymnodinialimonas hymeniacidonis TaxID=3126508 RepID=UPI0034C67C95
MAEIEFRDLAPGDAGWLIEQHAMLYAADEGFDASFEALVARILADFIDHRRVPVERAWIAWDGNTRLGSIFCVHGPDINTAKLRLFLLVPEARGRGLGRQMLTLCLNHARSHGFKRLTLWTHESHRAACALYEKAGFTCNSSKPVRSFGVDLIEQEWTKDLTA